MTTSISLERRRFRARLAAFTVSTILASGLAGPAMGQAYIGEPLPERDTVDANGMSAINGMPVIAMGSLTIGAGNTKLMHQRTMDSLYIINSHTNVWRHNYLISMLLSGGASDAVIDIDRLSSHMTYSNGVWTDTSRRGNALSSSGNDYLYITSDGTTYTFSNSMTPYTVDHYMGQQANFLIKSIKYPDGEIISFKYDYGNYSWTNPDNTTTYHSAPRIRSAQSSKGYQLNYKYKSDIFSHDYGLDYDWYFVSRVQATNLAVDFCSDSADSCSVTAQPIRAIQYDNTITTNPYTCTTLRGTMDASYKPVTKETATDENGNNTYVTLTSSCDSLTTYDPYNGSRAVDYQIVTYVKLYGSTLSSPKLIYSYASAYPNEDYPQSSIINVWRDGGSPYTYALGIDQDGNINSSAYFNPASGSHYYNINTDHDTISTETDEANRTISYYYDDYGRLTRAFSPEGNSTAYTYDTRGNITQVKNWDKAQNASTTISSYAGYDSTCSNVVKCNQPNWAKDALGNETDYTYDATTGLRTSVTNPADASGVRPQSRYSYSTMQAYYKNSGGSTVASGVNSYLPISTSVCRTTAGASLSGTAGVGPFTLSGTASCAGAADETKTTTSYGAQTSGTANNLLPVSQTVAAGDGSLSATTSVTYDTVGNQIAEVGPLGSSQTTVHFYDAGRRLLGTVGPDPDGSGSLTPAAVKNTYNADNVVVQTQVGTVPDQSSSSFTGSFTESAHTTTSIDAYIRPIRQQTVSGSTTYSAIDTVYDNLDRVSCTVQYMNMSAIGSQATSCSPSQTTGTYGPDRVTQITYDPSGLPLSVTEGVGLSTASTVTTTYTTNGKKASIKDGDNNLTTYTYDGFDRPLKTTFASTTQGANAVNTSDYEQYGYDANGHLTSKRKRDGNSDSWTFDNIGRPVSWTSGGTTRAWAYNLAGQPTSMTSAGGGNVNYGYDALGRVTSEAQPYGTTSSQYDVAGNRTRLTWSDAFYVNYDYDVLNRVTKIRENGATSGVGVLASYGYDSLGRRTSVSYGNGTGRTYEFDALNRPTGLLLSFPTSSNNQLIGAVGGSGTAISYTPSSQIASITKSNNAYAFGGYYNVNRAYTTNGLNQYSASGGTSLGYDAKGNLTSSGSTTYSYDSRNLLTGSSGVTLSYDNPGRLTTYSGTNFSYDGPNLITEFSSGTITHRYVPGSGTDKPIVWYAGSGTSDRRFLQSDERGSIVAVSDSSGGMIGINSYDEYGIPASTNIGRFQYTGQTWYPTIGLYNYKARFYSPTLGRFMQTDPIGYGDGINWYNYVGGDPVNALDPSGLSEGYCGGVSNPNDALNNCVVTGNPNKGHASPLDYLFGFDYTGNSNDAIYNERNLQAQAIAGYRTRIQYTPQRNSCPKVGYNTYALGGSGTIALFIGVNVSVSIGVAIPKDGNLLNVQYFASGQGAGMLGIGAFAGAGATFSKGTTSGVMKNFDTDGFGYGEADAGVGFAVGGSVQGNRNSSSGSVGLPVPKVGAGYGAYAGVGLGGSATVASTPFCASGY